MHERSKFSHNASTKLCYRVDKTLSCDSMIHEEFTVLSNETKSRGPRPVTEPKAVTNCCPGKNSVKCCSTVRDSLCQVHDRPAAGLSRATTTQISLRKIETTKYTKQK